MENKKAVLKRTFEQIRELFEDAIKLESIIESVSSENEFEKLSLTGNVIINSLVSKLTDVDDNLKSVYSKRMKRKRGKVLKRAQKKHENDKKKELEQEASSSNDEGPIKKTRLRNVADKETSENLNEENKGINSSKGSVENENPNSEPKSTGRNRINTLDRNSHSNKRQESESELSKNSKPKKSDHENANSDQISRKKTSENNNLGANCGMEKLQTIDNECVEAGCSSEDVGKKIKSRTRTTRTSVREINKRTSKRIKQTNKSHTDSDELNERIGREKRSKYRDRKKEDVPSEDNGKGANIETPKPTKSSNKNIIEDKRSDETIEEAGEELDKENDSDAPSQENEKGTNRETDIATPKRKKGSTKNDIQDSHGTLEEAMKEVGRGIDKKKDSDAPSEENGKGTNTEADIERPTSKKGSTKNAIKDSDGTSEEATKEVGSEVDEEKDSDAPSKENENGTTSEADIEIPKRKKDGTKNAIHDSDASSELATNEVGIGIYKQKDSDAPSEENGKGSNTEADIERPKSKKGSTKNAIKDSDGTFEEATKEVGSEIDEEKDSDAPSKENENGTTSEVDIEIPKRKKDKNGIHDSNETSEEATKEVRREVDEENDSDAPSEQNEDGTNSVTDIERPKSKKICTKNAIKDSDRTSEEATKEVGSEVDEEKDSNGHSEEATKEVGGGIDKEQDFDATSGEPAREVDKDGTEKSLEKDVGAEGTDKLDPNKSNEGIERDTSLSSETTILLDNTEQNVVESSYSYVENNSESVPEEVDKTSKNMSEFLIPIDQLDQVIDNFLSTSQNYESNGSEEDKNNSQTEEPLLDQEPSLVVIDDDSEDDKEQPTHNFFGKIKVVDLATLTTATKKADVGGASAKELPKMPMIRVASFAKEVKSLGEDVPSKDGQRKKKRQQNQEQVEELTKWQEEKNKEDKAEIVAKRSRNSNAQDLNLELLELQEMKNEADEPEVNGKRSRNPHAQKLNLELIKLQEKRHRRLDRERLLEEKAKLEAELESKRKRKERKEKKRLKNDTDAENAKKKETSTTTDKPKAKRRKKKKDEETFVIPNNLLVPLISQEASVSTEQVKYSVAKPDELNDKKLLHGCYVRMMTRQPPEQLQIEYSIMQQRQDEEKELLGVAMSSDDADAGEESDGESDSRNAATAATSAAGGTMVSSGTVGKRRPMRSCNSRTASSTSSSRNSSRSQRSTRNAKPIIERQVSSTSSSEEDEDEKEEVGTRVKGKAVDGDEKRRSRVRRPHKGEGSKMRKNGNRSVKGESSSDNDESDALSHVSISSSSEAEAKKTSNKKSRVKASKSTKSAPKTADDSNGDNNDCDSDSLPLKVLPDIKPKKENRNDDSDDFEPDKKKDKKNHKKDSDTEIESDSEDSINAKKKAVNRRGAKKKRVVSDSDEEDYSESDGVESIKSSASEEKEKAKTVVKKQDRKRIKRANDDSSDDSNHEKSKRGKKSADVIDTRKHIRNIIGKKALTQSTIDAEQEESDRKKRIADKQIKYNDIYNPNDLESTKLEKVVLDIDEDTNEEILSVDKKLVKYLKPHQAKGIQFMWDACFESISMVDGKGSGCILAHCMGLGKTLQVIALIHTLILNSDMTKTERALVVCPLSTVLNWVSEFKKWLKSDIEFEVYELVSSKQTTERQCRIADWYKHGGVMIMGYDMFRNLSNPDNKRISRHTRNTFIKGLVDPGPDLVICDEGHLLKNEKTSISIAMNRIRTLRRIVLTGTPLQNNMKEYFCMVQFVKPNLLGTFKEYLNRFVNPITNGQYTDSTPHDIQIMRRRSHVLHKLLDGIVQRKDYAVLAPYLPPKHEYVLFVTLTPTQISLYDHYLNVIAPSLRTQASKGVSLFKDFQEFQRICTHPRVLLDKSVQEQMAKWKEEDACETDGTEGSLKEFIDDDDEDEAKSTSSDSSRCSFGSRNSDQGPRRGRSKPKPAIVRTTRALAAEKGIDVVASTSSLEVASTGSEWWRSFASEESLDDLMCSSKLALLFEILQQCELIGDKVLIFSQSLYSLTIIEYFLSKIDDAEQTGDSSLVGGYASSWSLGLDYFRLDGSSSCDNRAAWCKTFNNPKNTRARLFLISTRAGGLGINLVAANRVIIFDVSWNPSHDIQSIYRVYRFGQIKPSYIYRFVSNGTMEMKVYERQVTKQAISKRVIDEQQIDRHYNQNDLAELYKFEPKPEHRPTPPVPKDVLLGELVHDKVDTIYKYHEHHTLLENKQDEELNEEERKAAWDEFENEKKMRQMPAHINNIPIHSIMLGLSNHLKRQHPDWSSATIQAAIPDLVQKMQENMLLGDVALYNSMILELRSLQQQQQQQQQQRMQDYYRLQQQNQDRMLLERHRQLMQNNATVTYLQRLYANATANNLTPAALDILNAVNLDNLGNLGNRQINANQPQIIETVDIND